MNIHQKPKLLDSLILSLFAILITVWPFFMNGKINLFETGLYLPGINALFHGLVPFRDFFHLRGPFELYFPALVMKFWKMDIFALYSYFYFGNVLCLILCILIARELFKTRYVLYLMVPVLIGRTFPRVVFMIWGGMRYALGLMAMLCMIKYFKRERLIWIYWAGIATCTGLFTSVEIGLYSIFGISIALIVSWTLRVQERKFVLKSAGTYALGILTIAVPYITYLIAQHAFLPYVESVVTIVMDMQKVIDTHLVSVVPKTFSDVLLSMVNPASKNFRHLTPGYLYIALLVYLIFRVREKNFDKIDLSLLGLGIYGFVMYNTGFRAIWAAQFEMALQPEKILFFFLLEIVFLALIEKKRGLRVQVAALPKGGRERRSKAFQLGVLYFIFVFFFASSIGYALQRYNHRFMAFKYVRDLLARKDPARLDPAFREESRAVKIKRAEGIRVPVQQADELEAIEKFVDQNIPPGEVLYTYPETGIYNFFYDRPFVGRFPLATFSWFNDKWHEEFMQDLKNVHPKYVILTKKLPDDWYAVYLGNEGNRQKYEENMNFIRKNYYLKTSTPLSDIYEAKPGL